VDRVLAAELSEEATRDQTVALARKRAGQLGDLPRQARLRRVLAYLARRGHRGPQAVEAAREAVSGGA
jgi:SOS response regulatory protein OraA/RecX